ncbi:hypothetical protein EDB86DRAFT_2958829 [Lactarius hatsudake]|nr:hypothetical protein EDB86DRAFT_2958829 [Lactarius hatsudake]
MFSCTWLLPSTTENAHSIPLKWLNCKPCPKPPELDHTPQTYSPYLTISWLIAPIIGFRLNKPIRVASQIHTLRVVLLSTSHMAMCSVLRFSFVSLVIVVYPCVSLFRTLTLSVVTSMTSIGRASLNQWEVWLCSIHLTLTYPMVPITMRYTITLPYHLTIRRFHTCTYIGT